MERHANYALVGMITTLLLIATVLFVVWLGQYHFEIHKDLYRVVFEGPVEGLSEGSEVQFNGIKVGVVQHIMLEKANANKVIMTLHIKDGTPVRVDSLATSQSQGISGVAVLEISAGSPGKPLLRDVDHDDRPTILADPDVLPSLFQGGGKALQAANATLARVDRALSDANIADLTQSMHDVRQSADALAAHRAMFARFDQASGNIAAAAADVRTIIHGDGRKAFADLAVAAHDLKDTVHVAHGVVVRVDGQTGVLAATTIPRLNTTLDRVGKAADAVDGLVRDFHRDPRAMLMKPKGRQLEIRP
jgi:phospholipid/cholesterol/gamma-HCH transport system substrate-binding protein